MSWVLHRIDDRLIHGQVLIAWGHRYAPRRLWLVDDATAADAFERELWSTAAPDLEVRVASVEEAAAAHAAEAGAAGNAFLLVRDLKTALALIEAGAEIRTWNVGGLHYAPGKDKVNEYVYLDHDDRRAARALLTRGVALEVQDVPASRPVAFLALDPQTANA